MYNLDELKNRLGDTYAFKQSKTVEEVKRILDTGEIADSDTVPFILEAGNLDIEVNIYFDGDAPPSLGYYCCARTTHMNGDWESYAGILEDVNLDVPDFEAEMFRVLVEFADEKGLSFFTLNEYQDIRRFGSIAKEHQPIAAENYKKLCELAPAFMNGDEDYAAFTSRRDITRLVELQRIENELCIQMTQTVQSGGHRAITDIYMSLLPYKNDGIIRAIDLYREGWNEPSCAMKDDNTVNHSVEAQLTQFLSGWLDDIQQYKFERIPEPDNSEECSMSPYPC